VLSLLSADGAMGREIRRFEMVDFLTNDPEGITLTAVEAISQAVSVISRTDSVCVFGELPELSLYRQLPSGGSIKFAYDRSLRATPKRLLSPRPKGAVKFTLMRY
jgi:hypothetical protein